MRWAGTGVLLASGPLLAALPPLWALTLATVLVAALCVHDELRPT